MKTKLLFLVVAMFAPPATAADFAFARDSDGTEQINVRGEIVAGDAERLSGLIKGAPVTFLEARNIDLSSPGGSISEALKLARMVDRAALAASATQNGSCASSCVLIWVAAPIRGNLGKLLIHRPYLSEATYHNSPLSDASAAHRAGMQVVRRYLEERSFPARLIDEMMQRSSVDAYELSIDDITEIGFLSPSFEEASIANCGTSGKDALERQVTPDQWTCISGMRDVARFQLLTEMIGSESARKAGRAFLMSKGGIEQPDGTIIVPKR